VTVSEIHYAPNQVTQAETLLNYLPNAKFVPDATATKGVKLVVGTDFTVLTVPSTTTTVPLAPGETAPTTTLPPTTTTTQPPIDECS